MKRIFLVAFFAFALALQARAQVTISPTMLFFENNFSSVMIINNANTPQDIQIETLFGYPVSDELGYVTMAFDEDATENDRSLTDIVRAFPRAFTLQPGQRQVVRLQARAPNTMPEGGYWTRLAVVATPQAADVTAVEEGAVGAQLNFVFRQVIAALYKRGDATVEMDVNQIGYLFDEERGNRVLRYNVDMTGNAPFLGTITLKVLNANGQTVHEDRSVTSIYVDGFRNFVLPEDLVPNGNYTVELNFQAARQDVPAANNFPMAPLTVSAAVSVN
ncbi:MAG: hypothetical protein HLUCCA01_06875 [Bacteroidetes bacterium HLUCCA01]|nr:MAG: hypothetical protein HLUCCA01_06875 [Bacteroidetes bacterium HLUCCA01]